jgi:hypothetical protein
MKRSLIFTFAIVTFAFLTAGIVRGQQRQPAPPKAVEIRVRDIKVIKTGPPDVEEIERVIRILKGLPAHDNAGNRIPFDRFAMGQGGFAPGGFGIGIGVFRGGGGFPAGGIGVFRGGGGFPAVGIPIIDDKTRPGKPQDGHPRP